MMKGIGIDIVDISRLSEKVADKILCKKAKLISSLSLPSANTHRTQRGRLFAGHYFLFFLVALLTVFAADLLQQQINKYLMTWSSWILSQS